MLLFTPHPPDPGDSRPQQPDETPGLVMRDAVEQRQLHGDASTFQLMDHLLCPLKRNEFVPAAVDHVQRDLPRHIRRIGLRPAGQGYGGRKPVLVPRGQVPRSEAASVPGLCHRIRSLPCILQ